MNEKQRSVCGDFVGDLRIHLLALKELTQQLVDISGRQDAVERFNAIDAARIATQEKLDSLVLSFDNYVRYSRE